MYWPATSSHNRCFRLPPTPRSKFRTTFKAVRPNVAIY